MKKEIKINIKNPLLRLPADFIKKHIKDNYQKKLTVQVIYDEPDICTKESLIILVEVKQ